MKKFCLLLAFSLLSLGALAQGRHEINLTLGGFKSEYLEMDATRNDISGDLYDLYEPHFRVDSGPVVTADYKFALNSIVKVGAQLNYGGVTGYRWYNLGRRESEPYAISMISLLPQVKLCIPGPRHFRLYGKVAAGVQYSFNTKGDVVTNPVRFAWDIVPIGAEWGGQRVYGTAEFCYGNVVKGGRIGMGFRF